MLDLADGEVHKRMSDDKLLKWKPGGMARVKMFTLSDAAFGVDDGKPLRKKKEL